jgi:hypothetical protein
VSLTKLIVAALLLLTQRSAFAEGAASCQSRARYMCVPQTQEQKLSADLCRIEMKEQKCEAYFKSHPELDKEKQRDCDVISTCPTATKFLDYTKACLDNWAGAWADGLEGIYHIMAGDISLSSETKARETFFNDCTSVGCKTSMLGPYVELFKKEEIQGHTNDKNLDPKDPVNQPYLEGLTAKVLYKKLLARISEKMRDGTLDQPVLEPWTGKPAKPLVPVNEMIVNALAKMGIKNTACYDPVVLSEMRCYALFSVLDPLLVAEATLKVAALSGRNLTKELAKSTVEKAPKEAKILAQVEKGRPSSLEALKAHNDVNLDKKISQNNTRAQKEVSKALEIDEPTIKKWQELGIKVQKDGTIDLNSAEVAQSMNSKMDELVASGIVKESDVTRPVLIYKLNGKNIAVSPNEIPPTGAVRSSSGVLSVEEFENFVADGKFPLGSESLGRSGNYDGYEPMFLHDLNHMIGFINNPEYMAANRKAVQKIRDTQDPELKKIYRNRYNISSEYAVIYPKEKVAAAKSEIENLKSEMGLQQKQFYVIKALESAMSKMDRAKFNELIRKISKSDLVGQAPSPLGGSQHVALHQVRLITEGSDPRWPTTAADVVANVRLVVKEENIATSHQGTMANIAAQAIFRADSFTRVRSADWMREGFSGEKISPMGNLGRICRSLRGDEGNLFYLHYCLGK